ncbi:hypothetical protein QCA50_009776 [Cerrena zonata]|uniref:FBD domain-containing protein n=1 Tax=Cerrena zonata TaxID=2478898 RepID=A0AAW0GCD7_9APHY
MQLQDKIETSNALKKYQILDRLVCANFQLGNIPTRGDDDAATMTTLMDAPHLREINVYDGYACPPSFIPFSRGKLPMLTTLRILAPLPKEYILPLWRDTVTHLELCVQQSIWEDFITMLKQLQNLEFLSLENSLPSVYQADRISLPNLRRLRIVDWLDRIAFGSSYFELDSEKMRNINYICYFRSKEKGSLWSFCRSLRSFLNTSILHLRVRRLNITDLEVTGWKKIESQSGEAHFRIELQRFTGRATKGEDRASFFKTLLEELRAFRMYPVTISLEDRTVRSHPEKFPGMDFDRDLNDVFGSPSHDICHTFHALPSVTSIYVDFFLAYGFIQKLFNLNIDDWRKLRECFVEGSDLPHWSEVESDSDQPSVITEETLKLPNKLTTIGITGGKSKCFEDAEIILRNAAEESPVIDSTVVIYVKS